MIEIRVKVVVRELVRTDIMGSELKNRQGGMHSYS